MKWVVIAAITAVGLFAWSLSRLSPETVGMAIGMLLGVLAGVPSAALVIVALRSTPAPTQQEEWDIEYPRRQTYADEVTPYTHLMRRVMKFPSLPDRQAEIDQLRQYLDYLESEEGEPMIDKFVFGLRAAQYRHAEYWLRRYGIVG